MTMKNLLTAVLTAVFLLPVAVPAQADDDLHKVVLHIDEDDPKRMHMVLNNAANITRYYQNQGEQSRIEIVAYGPGLMMMHGEKSPVARRMAGFGDNFDNVSFKVCGNTHRAMSRRAGAEMPLIEGVEIVPSGAVHLIQRQEEGWAYLRP